MKNSNILSLDDFVKESNDNDTIINKIKKLKTSISTKSLELNNIKKKN
jgi:hypothetical protein